MLHPREESFGTMERKHAAAAVVRIEAAGKERLLAGAFVTKWKRRYPGMQARRHASYVLGRLFLNFRQSLSLRFRFNRAERLPINEQRVIGFTCVKAKLA